MWPGQIVKFNLILKSKLDYKSGQIGLHQIINSNNLSLISSKPTKNLLSPDTQLN